MPKPIVLRKNDKKQLTAWVRSRKIEARMKERSRIILLAADGWNNTEIANELGIDRDTACKWRKRYHEKGIDGLSDAPRSGRPKEVSPELEKEILHMTLNPPSTRTHWSTRPLAKAVGSSHSTVHRLWKAHDMKPHIVRVFKMSNDKDFNEKVEDIVGLYMNPPDNAIVLCIDEKSQIQALDRSQPILPIRPGLPEHQSHDYRRHGTTTLFAALEVASGRTIGSMKTRHRAEEFIEYLDEVAEQVPRDKDVCVVLDNLSTHKTQAVKDWLIDHPRWRFYFTPTGSSWMNLVERVFGKLQSERLKRGVFTSVDEVETAVIEWLDASNSDPVPLKWTKTAKQIIRKVERYKRTYNTLH